MAIISLFSTSLSLRPNSCPNTHLHPSSCLKRTSIVFPSHSLRKKISLKRTVRAIAEEETLAPEVEQTSSAEQIVTIPASPSDLLTMFFKAEGTMDDAALLNLDKALKGRDGVSDLKVQNIEGIASVELAQQTTVQVTGVASNLVEIIQSAGFKLQTLYLSFEDEEDSIN